MKLKLHWALPLLVAAAVGCGGDQSSTNQMSGNSRSPGDTANASLKPLVVGIVYDKGGLGDKSFNDSANAGIERAKKDLGITVKQVQSKDVKDYEKDISAMAEQDCDIVFAIGAAMKDAVKKASSDYPNVRFAIVDESVQKENVRSLLFKEEQGSFLAGYLAGLMTKTNKLGFVGGMEFDLIKKFYYGYAAGAKAANPQVEMLPAKYTGDWDNVDQAKVTANTLFGQGADIVYHAAGRAGQGVIDAAKDHKLYAIGVDRDQDYLAPGYVLTSMVKHVDVAVYQTIRDMKQSKFTAGDVVYDLKAGGVGLSPMTYTAKEIGKDKLDKVKAAEEKIASGKIVVPATEKDFQAFSSRTK